MVCVCVCVMCICREREPVKFSLPGAPYFLDDFPKFSRMMVALFSILWKITNPPVTQQQQQQVAIQLVLLLHAARSVEPNLRRLVFRERAFR